MNKKYFLFVFSGLLIFSLMLCTASKNQKNSSETSLHTQQRTMQMPEKVTIEIKADGEILHYRSVSLYSDKEFQKIIKPAQDYSNKIIGNFKNTLKQYNKKGLNCTYKLDSTEHLTILTCDIRGAIYGTNSYDFHWLLADLPFDLYQFTQSKKELTYSGKIDELPTTIHLIFNFPIAHCHEHVWPAG